MKRIKITVARRQLVFARDSWRCVHCGYVAHEWEVKWRTGRPYIIPLDDDGNEFVIDHIRPYIETQDNSLNNLATSCWRCNNKKSNRIYKIPKNFPQIKLYTQKEVEGL
jgi:5-methylcytosine-specific restriction endonuclease McrA